MSKEHKRGLPSEGELTDDELEISGVQAMTLPRKPRFAWCWTKLQRPWQ